MRIVIAALALILATPLLALAADPHAPGAAHVLPYTHPVLPPHPAAWVGVVVIVIAGMFLAAASIGPVVRANMPEDVPETHSPDAHSHGRDAHGAHGHH